MSNSPKWIVEDIKNKKKSLYTSIDTIKTKNELEYYFINTICYQALCPNKGECFKNRHATFLILGTRCTRNCKFCCVDKSKPLQVDLDEPKRIANLVKKWKIKYVVFTSPTRDDLEDGGANQFANTIKEIKNLSPDTLTEPLIPDFKGLEKPLKIVLDSNPTVLAHNIETVEKLYPLIRPMGSYKTAINLLKNSKKIRKDIITKSSIIIGMGEEIKDIEKTISDLRENECDILVIGQYLSPTKNHYPVKKYYIPQEFKYLEDYAYKLGFKSVVSSPLARSSYKAYEAYVKLTKN